MRSDGSFNPAKSSLGGSLRARQPGLSLNRLQTVCRNARGRLRGLNGAPGASRGAGAAWVWLGVRDDFRNWAMAEA
jgi:hypothetical protein